MKKQFIITVGPTGSGKGRVLSSYSPLIQREINKNNPDYYNKNLDDLVQESPEYIYQFDHKFLKSFKQTFFENDMYTHSDKIKETLYTKDINNIAKSLDIQPKQQCFTKTRIDDLIQDPTMSDSDCTKDSLIKQQIDDLYFSIRNSKNTHGDTVPIQSEILLHEALKAGKNIIYEITGENIYTIKALCGHQLEQGKGPTRFKFPGTPEYRADKEYIHDYEIILLIPYTHSWGLLSRINSRFIKQLHEYIHDYEIETGKARSAPRIVNIKSERDLINRVSNIYKNIKYIIQNKCVDKLFLYDNNNKAPSKILELIFDNKQELGHCKELTKKNKIKYREWKRGSVDIPDFTRYIDDYCDRGQQNGGANRLSKWIHPANKDAYSALKQIFSKTGEHLNKTFSFYNMSICWVYKNQSTQDNYYLASLRVTGFPDKHRQTVTGSSIYNKDQGIQYANSTYLQWDDTELDQHKYVDYAGDIYNKWNTPFGYWRTDYDKTLVLLYKYNDIENKLVVKDQQICDRIVDGRVFCTFEKIDSGDNILTNAIISGSTAGPVDKSTEIRWGIDPKTNQCILIPPNVDKAGWKQGMVHVFSKHRKHIIKGEINNSIEHISDMTVIHPCASVIGKTEKNYAMMYFQHESKDRFNPNKGVLLNFHMTRPVPGVDNSGLIFYFKPIDFDLDSTDNLFDHNGWSQPISPRNSDIFVRIQNYYASQVTDPDEQNLNIDNFGRISCTTPLNYIDYGADTGKLITGVAHLKINLYEYLHNRIFVIGNAHNYTDVEQVLPHLEKDNVYRFYKYKMVPWLKKKVLNNEKNKAKYTARNIASTKFWNTHRGIPKYLEEDCAFARDLLLHDGIISHDGSYYEIIRHLHPSAIYFMIIYRVSKTDLTLHSFSNPFIINNEVTASFLNFPMGLTTNKDDILLSYGDGDCKSYVACIDKDKFNGMCVNTNSSRVDKIPFDLYVDL